MSWFARYLRSSVGAKHVMAVTGLLLLLFAIFHMVGHLQMFGGPAVYNRYANFLQELWEVKWPVRAILLLLLIIHVVLAIQLTARNRAARHVSYAVYRPQRSSIIGRTMAISGLVILAFLILHIIQFTIAPSIQHNAYAMYVEAFQQPLYYVIYLVGIGMLMFHLGHGAASWLQSLGWRHPKYPADRLGTPIALILFLGYMVPPTFVLAGVIK